MNKITSLYEMMALNTNKLVIPEVYQRRLNTERVAGIVAEFDERIANEPKVSFRDGKYYIFDGQHTVVARKQLNGNKDLPILCKVYYGIIFKYHDVFKQTEKYLENLNGKEDGTA